MMWTLRRRDSAPLDSWKDLLVGVLWLAIVCDGVFQRLAAVVGHLEGARLDVLIFGVDSTNSFLCSCG